MIWELEKGGSAVRITKPGVWDDVDWDEVELGWQETQHEVTSEGYSSFLLSFMPGPYADCSSDHGISSNGEFFLSAQGIWSTANVEVVRAPLPRPFSFPGPAGFSGDSRWFVKPAERRDQSGLQIGELLTGTAASEPIRQSFVTRAAVLDSQGRWLLVLGRSQLMRWEVTVDLGESDASRLSDWATALAGFRVDPANGNLEAVTLAARRELVRELPDGWASGTCESFRRLVMWTLASKRTRRISPNTRLSVPEYLFRQIRSLADLPGTNKRKGAGLPNQIYNIDPAFPLTHIPLAQSEEDKTWAHKLRKMDVDRLPGSCDYTEDLDPVEVCTLAGRMCLDQEDAELAREALDKALALAPDNIDALRLEVEALDGLEMPEEAWSVAQRVLELCGEEVRINDLVAAGDLARRTGRIEESRKIWERVASRAADT